MEENVESKIWPEMDMNIKYIKELLKDNSDIVYRKFNAGKWRVALIYIDGMSDKILLDNFVLESLMIDHIIINKVEDIRDHLLTVSDVKEVKKLNEGIVSLLSGDTLMFIDGLVDSYVIGNRLFANRGVMEPAGETVVRGSREGFTEILRFNTALVRRRIRDTRLRIQHKYLGVRSKTDVVIMYIDDIVNKEILKELLERVNNINIDAILDSGYVEQLIEDNKWSPFPQLQSTERPDVVAAALYEGRISIIVDNSPFAIIIPATLPSLFQSPDDYYQRWLVSSLTRIIRLLSIILSLILAPLYVAITSFHTATIPTRLAYAMAATREGIPFPAFIETIIMEFSLWLLLEAIIRLPKPIGATIGIVGGLIIGQAAVNAGIVSPAMIIIVSITAISNFVAPNYQVTAAFRYLRFLLIIAASIAGLYGIVMCLIATLIHLIRLKSFGVPYLSPIVNVKGVDYKDMFIRAPWQFLKVRPEYIKPQDKIRQK